MPGKKRILSLLSTPFTRVVAFLNSVPFSVIGTFFDEITVKSTSRREQPDSTKKQAQNDRSSKK